MGNRLAVTYECEKFWTPSFFAQNVDFYAFQLYMKIYIFTKYIEYTNINIPSCIKYKTLPEDRRYVQ